MKVNDNNQIQMIKQLNNTNTHQVYEYSNPQAHFHIITYSPKFTNYTIHQMQLFTKHISKYDTCQVMQCAQTTLYAYGTSHHQGRHLKIHMYHFHCEYEYIKYFSHRQYRYKYLVIANMDITIRLLNA